MDGAEYNMIQISIIPQQFVEKYNLKERAHNGYIFARITNGMYGIPQVGIIAHDDLVKHLEPYAYLPSRKTPGTMDTLQLANQLHLVSQRFWGKIFGKISCPTPKISTRR